MNSVLDRLLHRARELGSSTGYAAVQSGDLAQHEEWGEVDELVSNLWNGKSSDGKRILEREITGLTDSERSALPADEALWEQLYTLWSDAFLERIAPFRRTSTDA